MNESKADAPKLTGVERTIDLTHMLFPWENDGPLILRAPGSSHRYIPIFDDVDMLRMFTVRHGLVYDKIKQIDEQGEFLESVREAVGDEAGSYKFMVNPYFTEEGRIRWTEVSL